MSAIARHLKTGCCYSHHVQLPHRRPYWTELLLSPINFDTNLFHLQGFAIGTTLCVSRSLITDFLLSVGIPLFSRFHQLNSARECTRRSRGWMFTWWDGGSVWICIWCLQAIHQCGNDYRMARFHQQHPFVTGRVIHRHPPTTSDVCVWAICSQTTRRRISFSRGYTSQHLGSIFFRRIRIWPLTGASWPRHIIADIFSRTLRHVQGGCGITYFPNWCVFGVLTVVYHDMIP